MLTQVPINRVLVVCNSPKISIFSNYDSDILVIECGVLMIM